MSKIQIDWKRHDIPGSNFFAIEFAQVKGSQWERVIRMPGVRTVCLSKDRQEIILQKEYRHGLEKWDWRLPGGKIFESLESMNNYLANSGDMSDIVVEQAKNEAFEEAGINIKHANVTGKLTLGATLPIEIYFVESTDWKLSDKRDFEHGEVIDEVASYSKEKVLELIKDGNINDPFAVTYLMQNFV